MTINTSERMNSSELPEEPSDEMAGYYGLSASFVARQVFGEDYSKFGTIYSEVDDVPHKITNYANGAGFHDENMKTGEYAGGEGLEGTVISETAATEMLRYKNHTQDWLDEM